MKLLLTISIFLQVVAVGVRVPAGELWAAIRRPAWIGRTVLAMFVAVPILAVVLVKTFDFPVIMKGAMLLMAISAAAPLLPGKLAKLGIDPARDASLAAVTTLLAIVLVPLETRLLAAIFVRDAAITPVAVAKIVATSFLVPLAIGMALNAALGTAAERFARWAGTAGFVVLGLGALVIVIAQRSIILPLLGRSLVAVVLFAAGALLIGHLLGGPDPLEKTSLAIATVTRHPGLALLIVATNFPQARDQLAAIIAFVIGTTLTTIPYTIWQKRTATVQPGPPVSSPAGLR